MEYIDICIPIAYIKLSKGSYDDELVEQIESILNKGEVDLIKLVNAHGKYQRRQWNREHE